MVTPLTATSGSTPTANTATTATTAATATTAVPAATNTTNTTNTASATPTTSATPAAAQASPQAEAETEAARPWRRVIRVTLGPLEEWRGESEGATVNFESNGTPDSLKVVCHLEKSVMGMPNPSRVEIYNLAADTRDAVRDGLTRIRIEAGWRNLTPHLVFQGSVSGVSSRRSGADIITQLTALPGFGPLARGVSSKSFGAGLPVRAAVADLAGDLPGIAVSDADIVGLEARIGAGGWSFAGNTKDGLTRLAEEYGFSWHIENGRFKALDDKSVFGDFIELSGPARPGNNSADTDSAHSADSSATSTPSADSGNKGNSGGPTAHCLISAAPSLASPLQARPGVKIRALYTPGLLPGGGLRLSSRISPKLNGLYRIHSCTLNLDTFGNDWCMDIDATRLE